MVCTTTLLLIFADPVATPAQSQEIAKHVANLEHPRFAIREQAAKELMAKGTLAKPAIRKAMASDQSETSGRASQIMDRIVEMEVNSLHPMPFLDALYYDVSERRYRCLTKVYDWCQPYFASTGRDGRPWHKYRLASEVMVRDRLKDGMSVCLLRRVLAAMHYRDEVFIGGNPPRDDESDPPVVVDWQEYLKVKR